MLEEMSWDQFLEWNAFDALEPFGEEREDFRSASVRQTITNVLGSLHVPNYQQMPLRDFLLGFGDSGALAAAPVVAPAKAAAKVEFIEMVIGAWCSGQNRIVAEGGGQHVH